MFVYELISKLQKYHRHDEIVAVVFDKSFVRAKLERELLTYGYSPGKLSDDDVDSVFNRFMSNAKIDVFHGLTLVIADYIATLPESGRAD